jgi:hypothetical protein
MDLMTLFGGRSRTPAPAATPAVADQATQTAQLASAGQNGTVPSGTTPQSTGNPPAIPPAAQGDQSPLANFADLWKADPNISQTTPTIVPNFNLDSKGLLDAASKVNFMQSISPELITKASSGDAAALGEVINRAVQIGFANSTAATGELVKQALSGAEKTITSDFIPTAVRNQAVQAAMLDQNPIFSDPAVQPMLALLQPQLQRKYPTASAEEIAAYAKQYLMGVTTKISGTNPQQPQSGNQSPLAKQDTDWTKFFE